MTKIIGKAKDLMLGLINGPDTELVEETQGDGWYEGDDNDGGLVRGYKDTIEPGPRYDDEPRWKEKQRPAGARQTQNNKVLEMYGKGAGSAAEVVIRHPMDVSEAAKVCDLVREYKVCVVDLTGMDRNMAQRIADFLGGVCYAVNGCVQRISKDIFIIAPEGVRITGDVKDELEKDGYVIPKASGRR